VKWYKQVKEFEGRSYDRDNGDGAAQLVVDILRDTGDVNSPTIQIIHKGGTRAFAKEAQRLAETKSSFKEAGPEGFATMTLGADDLKDELKGAIKKAVDNK
jgi:hypothetical protein